MNKSDRREVHIVTHRGGVPRGAARFAEHGRVLALLAWGWLLLFLLFV